MAAVVAPHHAGLWQHRTDQAIHIPNMNMSGLVPPYDSPTRTATNPPASRTYQPTSSHMDMHMPLFSTHTMTTSVPYQPGAFAFDSLSVNPYNMQQAFPVSYAPNISQSVSYTASAEIQPLPTVREARNAFAVDRTPPVKSEGSSPIQPSQMFTETPYNGDFKRSSSEPQEASGISFSTDVDTLMRAIQAKQKPTPQRPEPPKVRGFQDTHTQSKTNTEQPPQEEEAKPSQKPKKRYQCSVPNCNKSFYQKTHLEIHTRAHTGVKPFVSMLSTSVDHADRASSFAKNHPAASDFLSSEISRLASNMPTISRRLLIPSDAREATHGGEAVQLRHMRQDVCPAWQCASTQDCPPAD